MLKNEGKIYNLELEKTKKITNKLKNYELVEYLKVIHISLKQNKVCCN